MAVITLTHCTNLVKNVFFLQNRAGVTVKDRPWLHTKYKILVTTVYL